MTKINWHLQTKQGVRVGYDATAICPHGTSRHLLVGTASALAADAAGLAIAHALGCGCQCTLGIITIDGLPFDREGGLPG